jgi:uncharacterized protein YkwD
MRGKSWQLVTLLLLLLLAACGTVSQQVNSSSPSILMPDSTAVITNAKLPNRGADQITVTPGARPTLPVKGNTPVKSSTPARGGNSFPPVTSVESQLEQQLFNLINQDRASLAGLPAYVLNSTMSNGALLHSWKMASCGLSHQCPGEAAPCQRVSNEGISWTTCGENVGDGSSIPSAWAVVQAIEQDMLNEPPPAGHRKNLLSKSFQRIGVGIYIDAGGNVWITGDFAD